MAISILKDDPKKSSQLFKKRGECNEKLKQYQEAIDDATTAIKLDATNAGAYWNRALAYQSVKNYRAGIEDYDKAIPFYKNSTNNLSTLYKNRGYLKYKLELLNESIKDDSMAVIINSKNGAAFWNRGSAYAELKQYQKAIDDYKTAVLYVDDKVAVAVLYDNIASNYNSLGQYSAAIVQESTAIAINPEMGEYYWNRGDYYQNNKDYQFSIDDFTKAIPFYKDKPAALSSLYNDKAYSEIWIDHLNEALKDNNLAINLNPKNRFAYWTRGIVTAKNGDHKQAGSWYLKASALYKDSPKNVAILYNARVAEEYYTKNADTLLAHCNEAISLNPLSYLAYYTRGKVYLKKLNQKSEAVKDFKKVIELDTSKKSISYVFSHYYIGENQFAVDALKNVILSSNSDVDLSTAYYNMACLCALMNNTDAFTYLQSAISKGYNKNYAATDDDFDSIKNTAEFKRLISSQ